MNGTTFSATAAILLRPPRMMTPAVIMRTRPMQRGTTLMPPATVMDSVMSLKNADSMFSVILLTCPRLPMPKEASAAKHENSTASTLPTTLQPLYEPRPSCR